jgi:hypothetical protein
MKYNTEHVRAVLKCHQLIELNLHVQAIRGIDDNGMIRTTETRDDPPNVIPVENGIDSEDDDNDGHEKWLFRINNTGGDWYNFTSLQIATINRKDHA